jgi:hypothetical protein
MDKKTSSSHRDIYRKKIKNKKQFVGIIFLMLALLFSYLTVYSIDIKSTWLANLGPEPDAIEYFAAAHSLYNDLNFSIKIGNDQLPSRFPIGFPILIAPLFSFYSPDNYIYAPFMAVKIFSIILLLLFFLIFYTKGLPVMAGVSTLLLATFPAFITYSRSPLSEVPSTLFIFLVFIFCFFGLQANKPFYIYAAAALLGLSLNLRLHNLFFAPILASVLLIRVDDLWNIRKAIINSLICLTIFILSSIPFFFVNYLTFGNIFFTGYDFWVPITKTGPQFSYKFILPNINLLLDQICMSWSNFSVADIFGTGTYFTSPFVILCALSLIRIRINRFVFTASLSLLSVFIANILFFSLDIRLFFSVFILLIPLAAWSVAESIDNVIEMRRFKLANLVTIIIFGLAVFGFPSRSEFPKNQLATQIPLFINWSKLGSSALNYEAVTFLKKNVPFKPSLVLSNINPVYLSTLLDPMFISAPVDNIHAYSHSKLWLYGKSDSFRIIDKAIKEGLSIYALFSKDDKMDAFLKRLPNVEGYYWKTFSVAGPEIAYLLELISATTFQHEQVPNVENWGPRETPKGKKFNIQSNGLSAMWVKVKGVSRHHNTHVTFGGKVISAADLAMQYEAVAFIVRDELIQKSGSYEVAIIEGDTGRKIRVGDFKVD